MRTRWNARLATRHGMIANGTSGSIGLSVRTGTPPGNGDALLVVGKLSFYELHLAAIQDVWDQVFGTFKLLLVNENSDKTPSCHDSINSSNS